MSANPHANGGLLTRELELPDFRDYALKIDKPGVTEGESTRVLGKFLRDVMTPLFAGETARPARPDELRV